MHSVGESENVVLSSGDGKELGVADETGSRPRWSGNQSSLFPFALRDADALGVDAHHERKRPGGDVVRLENPAGGGGLYFGVALNAEHFVDEAAVGLSGGDEVELFVGGK